jgi:hypothetical protein
MLLNYSRSFFSSRLILSLMLLEIFWLLYMSAALFQYTGLSFAKCSKERKRSRPRWSPKTPDSRENMKLKKLKLLLFHNIPTVVETLKIKQALKMPLSTKDLS